jgi:hypothetical protein
MPLNTSQPCPTCQTPVGTHTIDGYQECVQGLDYHLPYEDIPGDPITVPGEEGHMVGEVTVMAATMKTAIGVFPILRFTFTGPGPEPLSRRSLPPINLLMDANGLRQVRQLVATATDKAILAARRAR